MPESCPEAPQCWPAVDFAALDGALLPSRRRPGWFRPPAATDERRPSAGHFYGRRSGSAGIIERFILLAKGGAQIDGYEASPVVAHSRPAMRAFDDFRIRFCVSMLPGCFGFFGLLAWSRAESFRRSYAAPPPAAGAGFPACGATFGAPTPIIFISAAHRHSSMPLDASVRRGSLGAITLSAAMISGVLISRR